MERDWDLIRHLLLEIEKKQDTRPVDLTIESHPASTVTYHLELLAAAGLIEGIRTAGDAYYPRGLTWQGHDFLDAIRDETVWNKTKRIMKEKVGSLSFDVLKTLASSVAKEVLDLT